MPAYIHGKNAFLQAEVGGVNYNISGDMNQITLSRSKDNPETTTFGDDSKQRVGGLNDATLNGAYIWNGDQSSASAAAQLLDDLMAGSTLSLLKYAPSGSISGCPLYTACMIISAHEVQSPVAGVVAGTFAFQLASGSVTTGCCA